MQQNGFSLVRVSDGTVDQYWVSIPPRIEAEGLRVDGAAAGWCNEDYKIEAFAWEVADPYQPEASTTPPRLIACAMGVTVNGGDIASIDAAFNLVAAIYLDIGQYMLLFLNPQPDAVYQPLVTGAAVRFSVIEKTSDYLIVEASDGVGAPSDAPVFNVQVYRMDS